MNNIIVTIKNNEALVILPDGTIAASVTGRQAVLYAQAIADDMNETLASQTGNQVERRGAPRVKPSVRMFVGLTRL